MQDFERAFHAELLLEADLESKQREESRKLPKWIRQYAYRAWQDRIYFDRNVTWFQQEVLPDHMFCHLAASLVPLYITAFSVKCLLEKKHLKIYIFSHDRPIVQGYPIGCQHRFTSPAEAKAIPHEGASALVIIGAMPKAKFKAVVARNID